MPNVNVPKRAVAAMIEMIEQLDEQGRAMRTQLLDLSEALEARAGQILHRLADAGILRSSAQKAGRSKVWIAPEIIDAVDVINATPRHRYPARHQLVHT